MMAQAATLQPAKRSAPQKLGKLVGLSHAWTQLRYMAQRSAINVNKLSFCSDIPDLDLSDILALPLGPFALPFVPQHTVHSVRQQD
jgi:hypothetical protein